MTNEHSRTPVALITGCSSGIGRATAILLAEKGWRVFATARRLETVRALESDQITTLRLDVTDEASMVTAVHEALARAGRLDALINNAGYAAVGPIEEVTIADARSQFETNAFGTLRLAQLVLPTMRAQSSGRIVNLSTIGGRIAFPLIGLYSGSKFALEAISDALRMETRPFGVHVIVIEPGMTRTNFLSTASRSAQRFTANLKSPYYRYLQPFNRFMVQAEAFSSSPQKVARVVLRALTAKRPHARYAATPDAQLMLALLPWLPDWKRDALWGWILGLREARAARSV